MTSPRTTGLSLGILYALIAATSLCLLCGCLHFPSTAVPAAPKPPSGLLQRVARLVSSPLSGLAFFKKRSAPPKAIPLARVGTVVSHAPEGNYAIVELQPGASVRTGDRLIITDPGTGEKVRLIVGEVRYPCFDADVEEGIPSPGDAVMR